MSQKQKKKLLGQSPSIVFYLVLGIALGISVNVYMDQFGADIYFYEPTGLLLLAGSVYAAMFFHTIVHEAGHLVFGLLSGYKLGSFRIFSFMWLKEEGKIKLKRLTVAGTGGQCLMSPPDLVNGKMPYVFYHLGGSILNAAVSALFLVGSHFCKHLPVLSFVLFTFALAGFLTAVINGIPMRLGTVNNDGYNTVSLSKNPEAMEAMWVELKIGEESGKGVRLKDMPSQWFVFPTDETMKNSLVASRGVYCCNRWMDEENFKEATDAMTHLLEIESGMVDLHRNLLICDQMYIAITVEKRNEIIGQLLTKEQKRFMQVMKNFPSVIRTEYVLALLYENNVEKAEKVRKTFEKVAKTYPYPQEIDSERNLMALADAARNKEQESI